MNLPQVVQPASGTVLLARACSSRKGCRPLGREMGWPQRAVPDCVSPSASSSRPQLPAGRRHCQRGAMICREDGRIGYERLSRRPIRRATDTASRRECAPRPSRRPRTWLRTVASEMPSAVVISRVPRPRSSNFRTSIVGGSAAPARAGEPPRRIGGRHRRPLRHDHSLATSAPTSGTVTLHTVNVGTGTGRCRPNVVRLALDCQLHRGASPCSPASSCVRSRSSSLSCVADTSGLARTRT